MWFSGDRGYAERMAAVSEAGLPPSRLWRNGGKVTGHTHSHSLRCTNTQRDEGERGGGRDHVREKGIQSMCERDGGS